MSSSESSDTEMIDRKRKKRCPETWKRNERKKARLLGSQYTTKTGKIVNKREVKADCTCKKKCMTKFRTEEKEAVLRALYEKGSKNEQDVYLQGLMECKPVVRKRPNKEAREKLRTAKNFALKFGRPQVDVCGQCEELTTKLKDSKLNDNAKRVAAAELMVHKRRAKKFYSKLKEVTDLCHEREDVGGIVFDYIQNMPLPVIPVQEMFYYRQLRLYGFEIHDLRNDTGHFYTYHEGQAAKGPNEANIITFKIFDGSV
ncbi:unnamed protein product [Acanthoscelides obtectus]|uniref:Uncharacterized protein n=1 Tax=Acanthoscelides obtectus TaxID=200917 RepID=A0A9P0KF96_ACAOB|nr:unnamed protein product [Acanthoscelides obtectus]CAK1635719.1 hypothetical protein AOBTE_LOCUS9460 [Acanthoscelides obtectus]